MIAFGLDTPESKNILDGNNINPVRNEPLLNPFNSFSNN